MRALLQRVSHASCVVDGQQTGSCGQGFLILLGVGPHDSKQDADKLWHKILRLRVFDDEAGKINLSLADIKGGVLVVSQFTLYADCRKGNRPSFTRAAAPEQAEQLYDYFCRLAAQDVATQTGVFGAEMHVELANEGPITIWLDTDDLSRPKRAKSTAHASSPLP